METRETRMKKRVGLSQGRKFRRSIRGRTMTVRRGVKRKSRCDRQFRVCRK